MISELYWKGKCQECIYAKDYAGVGGRRPLEGGYWYCDYYNDSMFRIKACSGPYTALDAMIHGEETREKETKERKTS
jgi:hypothetical protein